MSKKYVCTVVESYNKGRYSVRLPFIPFPGLCLEIGSTTYRVLEVTYDLHEDAFVLTSNATTTQSP